MKITNEFFEQNNTPDAPLVKLCKCNGLPAKTSYWLSRLLQKLEPLNEVYNAERKKLIEKWCDKKDGKPDAENGQYKLTEHVAEFNAEFQELLAIELELGMNEIIIPLDKIPDGVLNPFDYGKLIGIIDFRES
jgi:hypothetical protein